MDEEVKEKISGEKERTINDSDKRSELEANDLIEKANLAAERLEAANKKQEELLDRQQNIMAKQILAGKAEAGIQPEKPKEESPEEYTRKFDEGKITFADEE